MRIKILHYSLAFHPVEKASEPFVIPSGARNLSFFSRAETKKRFLAPLGVTKLTVFRELISMSEFSTLISFSKPQPRRRSGRAASSWRPAVRQAFRPSGAKASCRPPDIQAQIPKGL